MLVINTTTKTSAWNSLPTSAKTADSSNSFKRLIQLETSKIRPIITLEADSYRCFIHYGLNEHLFQRNLVPNPNCACGMVEHNSIIFSLAPNMTARAEMLMAVHQLLPDNTQLTSDTLLFGIDGICNDRNTNIFKAVQKYIARTKRSRSNILNRLFWGLLLSGIANDLIN